MILPARQLVYLHPSKTAGTSVEIALLSDATGLSKEQLWQRGRPVRENFTRELSATYGCWDSRSTQHLPYRQLFEAYPQAREWRKVVTVRHPYARAISEFRYQMEGNRGGPHPFYRRFDINSAVLSGLIWTNCYMWHATPQSEYLGPGVEIMRQETLDEDWQRVIGFCALPRENVAAKGPPLRLSDEAKEVIARKYAEDFRLLGYAP